MASSADVQYDQLIEWLLNRGKVQRLSWVSQLEALYCAADEALKKCQEQTEHAKEEGPVSDAFSISSNSRYFRVSNALMRLENAERKSKGKVEKNVFGSYSNPELKKLYQIKCFFEKKNLHLVDASKVLNHLVKYEYPSINSSIKEVDTQLNQLSRKVADFKNLAQKSRESFLESCKEFGIAEAIPEGEVHLTSEYLKHLLQQSSKENLSILVDIEKKLKNPSIGDMINFYEGFTQFTFQFQDVGEPPCSNQDFCPTLREFGRSDTICTQIDAEVENVGSDTEWDIQIVESGAQNPESGFDGETYEELPETLTEFEGNDHETLAKDSSKVNSALSLMLIENRTRITLELNEILSFIKSRIQELEVSNGDMSYLVLIDTSFVRHDINKGLITLSGWVAIIEDILAQLKSHSLVNSLRIQSSSFFLDQISRSLVSKYELEFRYRTKMRQISNQRGELALSRETLCSNLDLLKRNLKTLRDFIEHQTLSLFPGQLQEFHLYGDLDLLFLH